MSRKFSPGDDAVQYWQFRYSFENNLPRNRAVVPDEHTPIHPNILILEPLSDPQNNSIPVDIIGCPGCANRYTGYSKYGRTNLNDLLENYDVPSEYKRAIFVQIIYLLTLLTNYDSLIPQNIHFSSGCLFVVMIDKKYSCNGRKCDQTDATTLKNIFTDLFEKVDNSRIANHFMRKMDELYNVPKRLLHHPFLWNEEKILNFLCQAFEGINGKGKFSEFNRSVRIQDWSRELILDTKQIRRLCNYLKMKKSIKYKPGSWVLKRYADEKYWLQRSSDLLRFIRNHKFHFPHNPTIQYLFSDSRILWKFLSRRFPSLFMGTYQFVKRHKLFHGTALQAEYFERKCSYSYLPQKNRPRLKRKDDGKKR